MSFGGFIQANTQVIVTIGPFVDVTDGFTPETGITLGAADEAELLKHGGTAVVDISAATWAAVTGCDGYYSLTLTTSHTDTEGLITIVVQDDSVCLPVKMTFQVMAQAAWTSLFTAKDTGYMDINVKAVSEDTTAADNQEAFFDGTGYAGTNNIIPTVTTLTGHTAQTADHTANIAAILTDTAEIGAAGAGLTEAGGTGDQLTAVPYNAAWDAEIQSEAADALTAFFTSSAQLVDDVWDEARSGHVGVGTYGETMATVETNIDNCDAPISTVDTVVDSILVDTGTTLPATLTTIEGKIDTVDTVADAILVDTGTTLPAEHAALPTAAENRAEMDSNSTQLAAIVADTNELQTDLTNGGRLDLLIDAILEDTNELQTDWTNGGRLDLLLDATLADTNALQQIFLSAFAEVTSKPAAGAALASKLAFGIHLIMQKVTFNKTTGVWTAYQDNGSSTLATRTLTDDGTTQTNGAMS